MKKKGKRSYNAGSLFAFCLIVLWVPLAYIFAEVLSQVSLHWLPHLIPLFAVAVFVAGKVEKRWTVSVKTAQLILNTIGWFNTLVALVIGLGALNFIYGYYEELLILPVPIITAVILYAQRMQSVKRLAVASLLALIIGICIGYFVYI